MATTLFCDKTPLVSTAMGTRLLIVLLLRGIPLPQAKTWPSDVSAMLRELPAAMATTFLPANAPLVSTATGTGLLTVLLLPSRPLPFVPQAKT